ncbi:MAG: carboxypeptidase-like regulatory domain-containing protein, partial [Terracidiphilus sp.]
MRGLVTSAVLTCCLPTVAQQTLGSLNGSVLDPTGAAVPGATVTVSDAAINVTASTTTQTDGFFQIFNLPIGTYAINVGHDGFDTTTIPKVAVQEAHTSTINITLKVGKA